MKNPKKILAVGPAGSYGHEAALRAQKMIDPNAMWDIAFCDTNQQVLDTAIEFGICAVVPVENSTGGPVKTIADGLFRTCGRDSKVRVIGEINLPIIHCLLARNYKDVASNFHPMEIVSHEQPFKQCSNFLSEKKWTGLCKPANSTSRAAQLISEDTSDVVKACIASAFAAAIHNLDIVEMAIQNSRGNVTNFAILAPAQERELMHRSISGKVIAIPGADGGYGKLFTKFFEKHDCKVLPIEKDTPLEVAQSYIERADVVFYSVPTLEAPQIMCGFHKQSNPKQLWLDVTSLKADTVKTMMGSEAEVVGLHPLCAPPRSGSFHGQSVAVCVGRLNAWGPWFASFLTLLEGNIDIVDSVVHDEYVMQRQGIPHALMFVQAIVMRVLNMDVAESFRVASPFYKLLLAAVCRMHFQNPHVYAGIQIGNPHMLGALRLIREKLDRLIHIVEHRKEREFIELFGESRKHIGMETLSRGNEAFEALIGLQADLECKDVLLIQTEEDVPGLFSYISAIIAKHGVNLKFIHTRPTKEGKHRFQVGLDRPTDSTEVFKIIQDINESKRAKVI